MVRRFRSIATREGRKEYSLILLEGTHLLQEAMKSKFVPEEIIATCSWCDSHAQILKSISDLTILRKVTSEVLDAAITTKTPDGVAALFPLSGLPKKKQKPNLVLALDRIQDPGNLGTLFRTAIAADVDEILLALGVDPLNQKALRSSAGGILNIPYERLEGPTDEVLVAFITKLQFFKSKGFQVLATEVYKKSFVDNVLPYWSIDWSQPTVLVLGNEGSGLHPLIKQCCTHRITLPHSSAVESLNVASAAVPLLLERQRVKMIYEMQNESD